MRWTRAAAARRLFPLRALDLPSPAFGTPSPRPWARPGLILGNAGWRKRGSWAGGAVWGTPPPLSPSAASQSPSQRFSLLAIKKTHTRGTHRPDRHHARDGPHTRCPPQPFPGGWGAQRGAAEEGHNGKRTSERSLARSLGFFLALSLAPTPAFRRHGLRQRPHLRGSPGPGRPVGRHLDVARVPGGRLGVGRCSEGAGRGGARTRESESKSGARDFLFARSTQGCPPPLSNAHTPHAPSPPAHRPSPPFPPAWPP